MNFTKIGNTCQFATLSKEVQQNEGYLVMKISLNGIFCSLYFNSFSSNSAQDQVTSSIITQNELCFILPFSTFTFYCYSMRSKADKKGNCILLLRIFMV